MKKRTTILLAFLLAISTYSFSQTVCDTVKLPIDTTHCGPFVLEAVNQLGATGSFSSFIFLNANGDTLNSDLTLNFVTIDTAGVYVVTAVDADNGCVTTDTINIDVKDQPSADFTFPDPTAVANAAGDSVFVCTDSVILNPGVGNGLVYVFTKLNETTLQFDTVAIDTISELVITESGKYGVTVTNGAGCFGADLIEVVFNDASFDMAGDTVAVGETVTIINNTTGEVTGCSVNFGDNMTASCADTITHIYQTPGTYTIITITDFLCGSDTTTTVVVVLPIPACDTVMLPADIENCGDSSSVTLTANSGFSNYTFTDAAGDTLQSGASNSIDINESGTYYVSAQDADFACVTRDTINITFYEADFKLSDDTLLIVIIPGSSDTLTFYNNATGATACTVNFGDGSSTITSCADSLKHAYDTEGTYVVTFTATFPCGTLTETDTVFVDQEVSVKNKYSLNGVNVYPNPSTGMFTIALQNKEDVIVTVYDVMSNVVTELTSAGRDKLNVDLSAQSTGIYLVKISSKEGSVMSRITVTK